MGVVKASYGRSSGGGAKSSKQATRYAANRKGEETHKGSREIYDKEGVISNEQAYKNIEKVDQQTKDAYHYRLTLSHASTGEGVDHNATTRETMQRLEDRHARLGGAVTWHAVNHTDHSNHEHTHVIAVTEKRISASDLAEMRAEMDRSYERHTPREVERQPERDAPRQEAERVTEGQHKGGREGGPEPLLAEQREQNSPHQEYESAQDSQRARKEPDKLPIEQTESKKPRSQQIELDWQFSPEEQERQRRDERYLEGKPSLITSGAASREFAQYKQLEATLDPQERRELHIREMEWRREQQAAGQPQTLTDAYYRENNAVLQDMRDSKHMPAADRQRFMDSRADDRWKERQVIERGLRGPELVDAYRERYEARQQDRAAQEPPERRLRWGEARREYNGQQAQRQERQAEAWSQRPPRNPRQQQRQERQSNRNRGGHDR